MPDSQLFQTPQGGGNSQEEGIHGAFVEFLAHGVLHGSRGDFINGSFENHVDVCARAGTGRMTRVENDLVEVFVPGIIVRQGRCADLKKNASVGLN